MDYLVITLAAAVAVCLFALSVRSGLKNAVVAGVIGGGSYCMYMLLGNCFTEVGAVFFATLAGCLAAELVARIIKTPATVLSIPVIIPLVPGILLYQSMLKMGHGSYAEGGSGAVATVLVAGSMSLAVTLATLIAKFITELKKELKKKKNIVKKNTPRSHHGFLGSS